MPKICAAEPSEFQPNEIDAFVALVTQGGEVAAQGLTGRVREAQQLAFLWENGQLIGVAGLKRPTEGYRASVAERSRTELDEETFPFELGWVFIVEIARGRGLSRVLCQPLMTAAEKSGVFATSRVSNGGMHSTLLKLGFNRAGEEWDSKQSDEKLALFLRTPETGAERLDPRADDPPKGTTRNDSDESYIVTLCDTSLGRQASRQHTFDFLRGDVGKHGRSVRLPVDAYYEDLKLVVEYRELQHDEAHAFFDKPTRMTLSGVHRGKQRALYDERRRTVLPQHGIALVEFSVSEFAHNKRGKLTRQPTVDMAIVRNRLAQWIAKSAAE